MNEYEMIKVLNETMYNVVHRIQRARDWI